MQRNRFAATNSDHCAATTVIGQIRLNVTEAGDIAKPDEVDFVGSGVEIVNNVLADWLCEDKQTVHASSRERVITRPGEDWCALRKHLYVVGDDGPTSAAVGISPAFRYIEDQRASVVSRRGNRERRNIIGLHRPGAVTIDAAFA